MNNKLYFLIGLPRSGKSTIAKLWQNFELDIVKNKIHHRKPLEVCQFDEENPRIVVNADSIRLALHGQPFIQEAEKIVHTIKEIMIKTYLLMGYDVLVDGTHTRMEHIDELLYIRKDAEYFLVDADVTTCKSRAIATKQEYLLGPIDRMATNLDLLRETYLNASET